jgi:hypothetical protein
MKYENFIGDYKAIDRFEIHELLRTEARHECLILTESHS